MAKKHADKTELYVTIFILLGGIALTVASFCIYYLVKPRNLTVLSVICAVDFIYNVFCTCMLFRYVVVNTEKWLLKGILLSSGYTVAFIAVGVSFIFFCGITNLSTTLESLKNNILGVVSYAFFTGPCIFIVLALFALILAFG